MASGGKVSPRRGSSGVLSVMRRISDTFLNSSVSVRSGVRGAVRWCEGCCEVMRVGVRGAVR